MTNKKNKLFTFFFSLIPGAGEMYLGFYKAGVSIMVMFGGGIALFGSLFPPLVYLLPVFWFYSFFHTHNLNGMSDEEFYALEDDYLFHLQPAQLKSLAIQYQKPLSILLILLGLSIIWNHIIHGFWWLSKLFAFSPTLLSVLRYWVQSIPQLAVAAFIIWAGWKLFHQKKESLKENLPPRQLEDFHGAD